MFQIPKEYFDLFEIISNYDVSVTKHGIPTYLLDAIQESVNEYNGTIPEGGVGRIGVTRQVQETNSKFYEVMSLHAQGEVTYFGEHMKMPFGYELTKVTKEETTND